MGLGQKQRNSGVRRVDMMAGRQLKDKANYAESVGQGYAAGIKREAMGSAKVGEPAPDFTAQTSEGKPFKLASVLGKKPVAIYFAAFDG